MNTKVQGMKKSRLRLGYGAGQAVADIYAFIFALLLSNALMGSPMIGGTFFLCGSIGSIIFGNKEAKSFLSKRQVCFNIVLYCALLVIDLLLIFYYPYDVQTNHVCNALNVSPQALLAADLTSCEPSRVMEIDADQKNKLLHLFDLAAQVIAGYDH